MQLYSGAYHQVRMVWIKFVRWSWMELELAFEWEQHEIEQLNLDFRHLYDELLWPEELDDCHGC